MRRGRRDATAFAPTAFRAGPDQQCSPGMSTVVSPSVELATAARALEAARVTALVVAAAAGVALHVVLVEVLIRSGAASSEAASARWWIRGALVVLVGAYLTFGAARRPGGPLLPGRERAAAAVVGVGGAVTVLGALDMHAFGLYELAEGSSAWDVVFHGAGAVAATVASFFLIAPSRPSNQQWIGAR